MTEGNAAERYDDLRHRWCCGVHAGWSPTIGWSFVGDPRFIPPRNTNDGWQRIRGRVITMLRIIFSRMVAQNSMQQVIFMILISGITTLCWEG